MKAAKIAAIVVGVVAISVITAGAADAALAGAPALLGVAGVAGSIGVSTGALFAAAGVGIAAAASSLMPKAAQTGSQTKWKADPYAGLPYVMGRTLVGGSLVAKRGSGGDNKYEHMVTVLSVAGPIKGIEASFANRTTVSFASNGIANGPYQNLIWQKFQLGHQPEPSALTPPVGGFPGWTAQHKLSGMAAKITTFEYDAKGKNKLTTEPNMADIIEGVFAYDPRLDDTYPGGKGSCRPFDETTYVWSEDPHIHGLMWAMGRYANGKRVAGIGAGLHEIDIATFVEGANLNAARGWKVGGQVLSRPDTPWSSLKNILQAGGSQPMMVGGRIACINRAPRVSLATITAADIVGDASFAGTQPRRTRINGIVPMYRSEAHDWEMVSASPVVVDAYVTADGGERIKEVQYPLVQQVGQVAQLAAYDICDAREAGPGTIPLGPWWLNYRVGDCVTFEPEDGFSAKVIINGRGIEPATGIVTYTVGTETDAKHAFCLGLSGTAPPTASIVYDHSVAAPAAAAWTLTGATLTSTGGSIPALEVDGAVDNDSASEVIFELRLHVAGQGDDDGWEGSSIEPAATTRKLITTVTPGTAYEVGVSYRVRGVLGDRLVLGPVTTGALAAGSAASATTAATAGSATKAGQVGDASDPNGAWAAADIARIKRRLDATPGAPATA